MRGTLRVKLDPSPRPVSDGVVKGIERVRLSLSRFGPGISLVKPKDPQSASLAFRVTRFDRARGLLTSKEDVGTVEGSISFTPSGAPVFVIRDIVGFDPADASGTNSIQRRPRFVDVDFAADQFQAPLQASPDPVRVFLEATPGDDTQHFEVRVELSVAGASEAAFENNDVLDVPLLPKPILRVRLVDEIGKPISGEKVTFKFGDEEVPLETDEVGSASVENAPLKVAELPFADIAGLVKRLKPRWDTVRPGGRLSASERVRVLSFHETPEPQTVSEGTTLISVQPRVVLAQLFGVFFDTSKSFLLPSAVTGMRGMKSLYDDNPNTTLLVVGHADSAGSRSYNDKLSVDRADAVAAYLSDDVEGWFKWYGSGISEEQRWGDVEDQAMISALPDAATLLATPDPISNFQRSRGLTVDGKAGSQTRHRLITEYMGLDGTSLPAGTKLTTHGCGENFLADPTPDGTPDPLNRRAELFFFDQKLGIQPPVPGKNSPPNSAQYPEWKNRAQETRAFDASQQKLEFRLLDATDAPLVGVDWLIEHSAGVLSGTTAADGIIAALIPVADTEATLTFGGEKVTLALRARADFPSAAQPEGAALRLANLGYEPGADDSRVTPELDQALRQFQKDHKLVVTGAIDPPTIQALIQVYGS